MARSRGDRARPTGDSSALPPSERELVVLTRPEVGLRASAVGVASFAEADVSGLQELLAEAGATMVPLFGVQEDAMTTLASTFAELDPADIPALAAYYRVLAEDEKLDALAGKLAERDEVEAAFVKPPAYPAMWTAEAPPQTEEPPAGTPDFATRQGYLNAAPGGIDARFAWTRPGGLGAGVRIIDIEGAWQFSHEDLLQNQGGVVGGTPSADLGWRNHGTAVVGEFGGDRNGRGVTGICPDANVSAVSIFGQSMGSARAIRLAADRLRAGDILLIELHRPGPRFNFQSRTDQRGFIAVEWWPDDYDAIRYAMLRGVIVVEAAGNGAENLDDAVYDARPAGFPATWSNPFRRRSGRDSGAIVVGAGAPPPGTHGRNHGPDRSRLDFSNYGGLLDAQGWGREVTTTGYGDLQGGTVEDRWYTDTFSGTSSASPIVVGALGCVQGALRARNRPLLTPATARQQLRATGSPQLDAPGRPATQRIGNRPDLRRLLATVGIPKSAEDGGGESGDGSDNAGPVTINIRRGSVTINVI
jgi:hypothetical protein